MMLNRLNLWFFRSGWKLAVAALIVFPFAGFFAPWLFTLEQTAMDESMARLVRFKKWHDEMEPFFFVWRWGLFGLLWFNWHRILRRVTNAYGKTFDEEGIRYANRSRNLLLAFFLAVEISMAVI